MAVITFTARTALAAGYISGQEYDIVFECSQYEIEPDAVTEDSVTLSGVRETILHRDERMWDVATGAMIGLAADQFVCFLASVLDGSTFTFDRFATIENGTVIPDRPIQCELANKGRRTRLGNRLDAFRFDFRIRAAAEEDAILYGENYYWDLDLTRGVVPDGWAYTRTGVMYALGQDGIYRPHAANTIPAHWDAVAGESLGAWFGPETTNRAPYSTDISNAAWSLQNAVKASCNSIIDGGVARRITATGSSAGVFQTVGTFTGSAETLYAIIEKGDQDVASIALYNTTTAAFACRAQLTFSTGVATVAAGSGTARAYKIATAGPNGGEVWLLALTTSAGIYTNTRQVICYPAGIATTSGHAYLHHIQLQETVSVISPPIVTNATSVTVGQPALVSEPLPPWFHNDEYSLAVEYSIKDQVAASRGLLSVSDNTTSNRALIYLTSAATSVQTYVTVGGVDQAILTSTVNSAGKNKVAARLVKDNIACSANGGPVQQDTSCLIPPVSRAQIGVTVSASNPACCYISRALIHKEVFENQSLIDWGA